MVPKRSTQPLLYVYFKPKVGLINEIKKKIDPIAAERHYYCREFVWRADLPPGVQIAVEEE